MFGFLNPHKDLIKISKIINSVYFTQREFHLNAPHSLKYDEQYRTKVAQYNAFKDSAMWIAEEYSTSMDEKIKIEEMIMHDFCNLMKTNATAGLVNLGLFALMRTVGLKESATKTMNRLIQEFYKLDCKRFDIEGDVYGLEFCNYCKGENLMYYLDIGV